MNEKILPNDYSTLKTRVHVKIVRT